VREGSDNRKSQAGVRIEEGCVRMHEYAAWPGAEAALAVLADGLASRDDVTLLAVGPGRYWVLLDAAATLEIEAAGVAHTDLSHAHTSFRLTGPASRLVLRKGLPIDLHPSVFPAGRVATSAIEGIVVTVINRGTGFELLCRRSFARSLAHWLSDAAAEFAGASA